MKEKLIDGISVLAPETPQQLEEALASGRPFTAPPNLAAEYGLARPDGDDGGSFVLEEDDPADQVD